LGVTCRCSVGALGGPLVHVGSKGGRCKETVHSFFRTLEQVSMTRKSADVSTPHLWMTRCNLKGQTNMYVPSAAHEESGFACIECRGGVCNLPGGREASPDQALKGQWSTCKINENCDYVTVQNSTRLTTGKPTHLGITTSHLYTRAMPTEVVSAQLNGHSVFFVRWRSFQRGHRGIRQ
jgi:hypothetical protein